MGEKERKCPVLTLLYSEITRTETFIYCFFSYFENEILINIGSSSLARGKLIGHVPNNADKRWKYIDVTLHRVDTKSFQNSVYLIFFQHFGSAENEPRHAKKRPNISMNSSDSNRSVSPCKLSRISMLPAGIWCRNGVVSTSMRRHYVASTLIRRHFFVDCIECMDYVRPT